MSQSHASESEEFVQKPNHGWCQQFIACFVVQHVDQVLMLRNAFWSLACWRDKVERISESRRTYVGRAFLGVATRRLCGHGAQ